MTTGRKKLTYPILRLSIPGDICKTDGLLLYLLTSYPSLFYKRPWHADPDRWLF